MSSCAVSCCICSPKVLCASVTSASWPIADVPPPCHFAFSCSALRHKPRQRHPSPAPVMLGFAPNVVDRCCSSKGLQLRSSSSVLRRPGRQSPHERRSTLRNFCVLLLANSLCVFLPNQFLFPTPRGHPRHITFEFSATLTFSRLGAVLSRVSTGAATPTLPQLNLHNTRPPQPRAASFKSLYRKRAIPPCSGPYFAYSRFRYSTTTYQPSGIESVNTSAFHRTNVEFGKHWSLSALA